MQVKVEEIQQGGLSLSEANSREMVARALKDVESMEVIDPGTLSARFTRTSGTIHLDGHCTVQLKGPCNRCGYAVPFEVPIQFLVRMVPEKSSEGSRGNRAGQGTFELDEADAEPFDGRTIDLDPIFREHLLLALPVTLLCESSCKGLCRECGADLNREPCSHRGESEVDPRFAVLKNIKLER